MKTDAGFYTQASIITTPRIDPLFVYGQWDLNHKISQKVQVTEIQVPSCFCSTGPN